MAAFLLLCQISVEGRIIKARAAVFLPLDKQFPPHPTPTSPDRCPLYLLVPGPDLMAAATEVVVVATPCTAFHLTLNLVIDFLVAAHFCLLTTVCICLFVCVWCVCAPERVKLPPLQQNLFHPAAPLTVLPH